MKTRRKITIFSLLVVLILTVSSYALAVESGQAPELKEMVDNGELPPVAERLPVNPKVLQAEEIGVYGGTLYMAYTGPEDYYNLWKSGIEGWLAEVNQNMELEPGLAESWEWSEDRTALTIQLREGIKWSDGEPITSDDFIYAWETQLDDDIPFIQPRDYVEQVTKIEKIDDQTFKAYTEDPQPDTVLFAALTYADGIAPKHHLKQFDPRYNDDMTVQDLEKAWSQERITEGLVGRPQSGAWEVTEYDINERIVAERNPYYYKVDEEGNQLPYVDRIVWQYIGDVSKIPLLAQAGQVSLQGRHIAFKDYTTYKENEEQGNFRTIAVDRTQLGPVMHFNYATENQNLRELYGMKDFRWALSYGTNRQEISERVYYGQVEPWGPFPARNSVIYPGDKYLEMYKNYNPDKANELLDSLGLKDTDGDGFREYNGEPIEIIIDADVGGSGGPKGIFEIVSSQWKKIGIDLSVNTIDRSLLVARWGQNANDAYKWVKAAWPNPLLNPGHWVPSRHPQTYGNIGEPIAQWFDTDGEKGVEPPEFIKDYTELMVKAARTSDAEKQAELGTEAMKIAAENVIFLTTTNYKGLVIADADLGNVPDNWLFGNQLKGIWSVRPDGVFYKNTK